MEGPGPGPILPGLPLPDWTDPTILDDVTQSTQTKFVGIAAITILLWDHLDSFPVEVCEDSEHCESPVSDHH